MKPSTQSASRKASQPDTKRRFLSSDTQSLQDPELYLALLKIGIASLPVVAIWLTLLIIAFLASGGVFVFLAGFSPGNTIFDYFKFPPLAIISIVITVVMLFFEIKVVRRVLDERASR